MSPNRPSQQLEPLMRPLPLEGAIGWIPGSSPRQKAIEKLSKRHGQRILVRFNRDRSAEVLGLRWIKLNRFRVQPDGEVTLIEANRSRHGRGTLVAMTLGAALVVAGVIVGIATSNDQDGPWWLSAAVTGGVLCFFAAAISAPKLEHLIAPGERWTKYGRHWTATE